MKNKRYFLVVIGTLALAAMACSLPVPSLTGTKSTAVGTNPKPEVVPTGIAAKPTLPASQTGLPPTKPPAANPTELPKTTSTMTPGSPGAGTSKFPVPPGGTVLTSTDSMAVVQIKMSLKECMAWYRETLGKQGLKERTLLTATTDSTFNLVFDGTPNGMSLIVQGTVSGANTTISLLYEKL